MSYFADLSKYTYSKENMHIHALNVGWLDDENTYLVGEVPDDFIVHLFEICCYPISKTRGWHPCPFCSEYPAKAERNNKLIELGSD
ncbi:MAG: hypothetical protein QM730_27450 [Anaerolineales bacterium]